MRFVVLDTERNGLAMEGSVDAVIREAALREAAAVPPHSSWQTPVQNEANWQAEAMRLSALLHTAMLGGAKAEAKLAKAVEALREIMDDAEYPDAVWERGDAVLAELDGK